jgi:hypothetical protein
MERAESYHEFPHPVSLSQSAREFQFASEWLPLPLGEGWGEGNKIHAVVSRATIWTSSRILKHSLRVCPGRSLTKRRPLGLVIYS